MINDRLSVFPSATRWFSRELLMPLAIRFKIRHDYFKDPVSNLKWEVEYWRKNTNQFIMRYEILRIIYMERMSSIFIL